MIVVMPSLQAEQKETFPGSLSGGQDAFIAKFDTNGTHQWTQQLGTTANDDVRRIILSNDQQRLYVGGFTKGNIDGQSTVDADGDYFMTWYDTNGNQLGLFKMAQQI